ncbi:MAG: fructose-1,6-bisphosphatase [Oscillospiraceae bacterium]
MKNLQYLQLLAKEYPSSDAVSAEIINLSAICRLPKGTEYFFSDIHGEADAFLYLLGTASGVIRSKIEALFANVLPETERALLSNLVYQPEEVLHCRPDGAEGEDWLRIQIYRLVQICRSVASKYTRSKVRKKMPQQFAYILDELLHADTEENKETYYTDIIHTVVKTDVAEKFISALCTLIRQCSIDQLHIIGDIFDRGPHADLVVEELMQYPQVDIQWGNHDIHWMGAAMGHTACIANVVRLAISYNNFDLLEDAYGINLRPLSTFAAEVYGTDECRAFWPHLLDNNVFDPIDEALAAKMHKAIAIIQFKLEGQLLARHPEYEMQNRTLLTMVDFAKGSIAIDGKSFALRDTLFPTIDPADPLQLSAAEQELMAVLARSFTHSPLLARHMRFLYNNGSMYKISNGNLLYHGCIPMRENGEFKTVSIDGAHLSGRPLLDAIDAKIRSYYYSGKKSARQDTGDFMWYLWCGSDSPLFGKSRLTTFERYFIQDSAAHTEHFNPYYKFNEDIATCRRILQEFGLDPDGGHIVNGHVPVRLQDGESPVKAEGRLFVIDGGISKAYHSKTGIGGYTLISNSHYMALAEHRPFAELQNEGYKYAPTVQVVERYSHRITVAETDIGLTLQSQMKALQDLLAAYRSGTLREVQK